MLEINGYLLALKRNYVADFGFIIVGISIAVAGLVISITGLLVVGFFIALLGLFMFTKTTSHNKLIDSMIEHYQKDPTRVVKMLEDKIEELNISISNELDKADRGGRDAKDSYDDAQRKKQTLNKYINIKNLISEKYIDFE